MTTLVRLSFVICDDQLAPFETIYECQLLPLLQRRGLTMVPDAGRPLATQKNLLNFWSFSQLFAVEHPAALVDLDQALKQDPAWQQALQKLAPFFGPEGWSPYQLGTYCTLAGPGKTIKAGPGQTAKAGSATRVKVDTGFSQGAWLSFGPLDGMPGRIDAMVQDRHHALWLAAQSSGLWRYDGGELFHFTSQDGLPHTYVTCLLEDPTGLLWIGTHGGVCRYDGYTFTSFTSEDGLVNAKVLALLIDRCGHLWIGTEGGVSRYDGISFTTITIRDGLAQNRVACMLEDRDGYLWFGSGWECPDARGVSRYDGQTVSNFSVAEGMANDLVLSLLQDREGQVWLGHSNSVSCYDGQRFKSVFSTDNSQHLGGVMAMLEDRDGQLWFAVFGEGLRQYDGHGFKHFTPQDGLTSTWVHSLFQDRDGQIWVGTRGSGISRYKGQRLATFTTADGLGHNSVNHLLEDRQGQMWVSTQRGVSRQEGHHFATLAGTTSSSCSRLLVDQDDNVWVGLLGKGISRWDGRSVKDLTPKEGQSPKYFEQTEPLLIDHQGTVWCRIDGESGGLVQWDGTQWRAFTADIGLMHHQVTCMLEDSAGWLWFGGKGGISRYDGTSAVSFSVVDGLAHEDVTCLLEDRQGHLWIGTQGGISRYDGTSVVSFKAADRLAHEDVTCLLEDRQGHLWIGTWGGGISRFDGTVFQSLSRKDGLAHDITEAICQDRREGIWIGTQGGLHCYQPPATPPQVRLRAVFADRPYSPAETVKVSATQKLITFKFEGSSLTTLSECLAYIYQLQGYDTDWQPAYESQVSYQDLPEGEYTFCVKAVDQDLNYSEPAQVQVTVEADALVNSLMAVLGQHSPQNEFVGRSTALKKVQQQLHQVAPADLTVLILGETGTGKGLAARSLHELSPHRQANFLQVNCGAIPEFLIESELFGHEKGAFTGADRRRLGKVELAKGGTLFLDEIGDMTLAVQVKLLQLLEERTYSRVGSAEVLEAQVRVVAATNRNLRQMVKTGTFREDLYFRLQGFELQLPPLRERREDIPLLALYFIKPKANHLDKPVPGLSNAAEAALVTHHWPGNVRELQHAIERAVVVCQDQTIAVEDLGLGDSTALPATPVERGTLTEMERRHIQAVLEDTGWVVAGPKGAAKVLGLKEQTLRARMKKLGIRRP